MTAKGGYGCTVKLLWWIRNISLLFNYMPELEGALSLPCCCDAHDLKIGYPGDFWPLSCKYLFLSVLDCCEDRFEYVWCTEGKKARRAMSMLGVLFE